MKTLSGFALWCYGRAVDRLVSALFVGARGWGRMNHAVLIIWLMMGCAPAHAATITADLRDLGNVALNTPVQFVPESNPQIIGGTINAGVTKSVTPTNGVIHTNIVAGLYTIRINPYQWQHMVIPTNDAIYDLSELSTNLIPAAPNYTNNNNFKLKLTSRDTTPGFLTSKLIFAGDGISSSVTNNPGTNESWTVTITGGGGATNGQTGAQVTNIAKALILATNPVLQVALNLTNGQSTFSTNAGVATLNLLTNSVTVTETNGASAGSITTGGAITVLIRTNASGSGVNAVTLTLTNNASTAAVSGSTLYINDQTNSISVVETTSASSGSITSAGAITVNVNTNGVKVVALTLTNGPSAASISGGTLTILDQTNSVSAVETNGTSGASITAAGAIVVSINTNGVRAVTLTPTNGAASAAITGGTLFVNTITNSITVTETNGASAGSITTGGALTVLVNTNFAKQATVDSNLNTVSNMSVQVVAYGHTNSQQGNVAISGRTATVNFPTNFAGSASPNITGTISAVNQTNTGWTVLVGPMTNNSASVYMPSLSGSGTNISVDASGKFILSTISGGGGGGTSTNTGTGTANRSMKWLTPGIGTNGVWLDDGLNVSNTPTASGISMTLVRGSSQGGNILTIQDAAGNQPGYISVGGGFRFYDAGTTDNNAAMNSGGVGVSKTASFYSGESAQQGGPFIYLAKFSTNAWKMMDNTQTNYTALLVQGVGSFATNAVSYSSAGATNTTLIDYQMNIVGTSGTIVYWMRGGANGTNVAATAIWTNTVSTTGQNYHLGVNCGIAVGSGSGVTVALYPK